MQRFPDEASAVEYFERIRWANGVVCPHCKNNDQTKFWKLNASKGKSIRVGLRQCAVCKKQFRVTVGTIFEDSHVPLNLWIIAWYLMCGAKKGMSALQLKRHLWGDDRGSYKTAWFMAHRIRHAMSNPVFEGKLSGTVEVDECYFGPKTFGPGFIHDSKSAVVALVKRETGERRSVVIHDRITGKNLRQAVTEHVATGSTLNTDEHRGYTLLGREYKHKSVKHSKRNGVREFHRVEAGGEVVTTNYAESSFSLLRRGVVGSFHHISRKHLPLYVSEFDFRWNTRKDTDGERTVAGLKKTEGKRLTMKPRTSTHEGLGFE